MPVTPNAFSLPSPASTSTKKASQPISSYKSFSKSAAAYESRAENTASATGRANEKSGGEEAYFAPFLALLTQAVDKADADSESSPQVLDLKLSAEYGQDRKEYTATLPITEGSKWLFSKSVLDLLGALKGDLEKNGVDLEALSGEVNEVLAELGSEFFSDWNTKTVEAMLAKFRERYSATLESDGPQNLDIEVKLSDGLMLGLEASLKTEGNVAEDAPGDVLNNAPDDASDTENKVTTNGYASSYMAASLLMDQSDQNGRPFNVSKIASYLKPDALRGVEADASAKDTKSKDTKSVGPENASTAENQATPVNVVSGTQVTPKQEKENPSGEEKREGVSVKETVSRQASKYTANSPDKTEEIKDAPKTNFTEHKTTFDQFFQGVMAKREGSSASAAELNLVNKTSFSQGDALREGLENVVRFIRTSGTQKAALIVDPPALGRVSVELISNTTGLEASIKVGSEQARQLIQDHLAQLRISLAEQGVQLTQFTVDVQQDNARRDQGEGEAKRRRAGVSAINAGEEESGDESLFRVDLNQGLLYWVA